MSENNGGHYVITLMHHATYTDLLADNHGSSRVEITWAGVLHYMNRWASENLDSTMDVVTFTVRKYGEPKKYNVSFELKKDDTIVSFPNRTIDYYSPL